MKVLLRLILSVALLGLPVLGVVAEDGTAPAASAAKMLTVADFDALNAKIASAQSAGDTSWILISAALVLLMTIPGLALFYGGLVRRKNVLSAMYYSMGAAIVVSVLWVVFQYSLAFGGSATTNPLNWLIGSFDRAFMNGSLGASNSLAATIPESVFSMFQLMFAIITVALISGSIVERMSLKAWLIFSALWSILVYAPLAHWVWGGGWLASLGDMLGITPFTKGADGAKVFAFGTGPLDFAGGLVVHISSGVSALVLALVLGPRVRYGKDAIIPNNIVFTFIGAGLLWVGWFGFNAGSAVAANGLAGTAFLNTNTAAAMAGLVWVLIEYFHHGKPTLVGASTAIIAGLVAITPAAGFVDLGGALWIGLIVAIVVYLAVAFLKKSLGYDDSLDAFGVHGIGGMVGALLTGVFANPAVNSAAYAGVIHGNPGQLAIQAVSILVAIGLSVVGTLICIGLTRVFTKLRVEPQEEIYGLDITQHGEKLSDR